MSVLLVHDEGHIRSRVCAQLQDQGIPVTVASTVADADAALARRSFDVVILELTSPDGSRVEVLDRLHASGAAAHVIVLSTSTAEADRVRALERGADDLLVKPFYLRELTTRVLAVGRRRDPVADTIVQVGHVEIDLLAREVAAGGEPVELTAKEFDLLAYLAVRPGHVFDREELLNAVWRSASEWQQAATVTEHIRRLRKKLEVDPARPELLTTVRGAGYRLDLPTAEAEVTDERGRNGTALAPGDVIHVDGLVVSCDQAAADLVGAAPSAVVGQRLVDLIAPSSLLATRDRLGETGAGPLRRSELMDFRHADAGEVTAAVASTPVVWQGQPARRLRLTPLADAGVRLRRQLLGVLGDLTDAVIITDLQFHIRSWNAAAERLYGWMEDEVRGRHVLDVVHWAGDGNQLPAMWERLEHTGRWHGESTQATRDGSVVEILSSMTLIRDEAGDPLGIVSVNRTAIAARRARSLEQGASLATRLRQGLADDEFVVHYQPVVDLAENGVITLEALARWADPERGMLLPDEFLDTAENSGAIVELGEVVLGKACRQAAEWRRSGADIHLSVNVSTRQLGDPGMVERFTSIVRAAGFDPNCLWIEVTETALVEELENASDALRRLVDLGVGVSIDDFGTGWASLTYLQNFPVHALKIDRSFVARAGQSANDTAIVRSILSLGAELGMFVVAEGIETEAQRDQMMRLGCAVGQGYLFGGPTPAHEVPIERARRRLVTLDLAAGSGPRPRRAPSAAGPGRPAADAGADEQDVVADMLRGLLRVRTAPAAGELLQRTIRGMGGVPVPAADASPHALPVDVSLGEGPPMLVEVEASAGTRAPLERLVPRLVEDARQAVNLLRRTERLVEKTARDELTGLANRRVLDRVLPRATSGSVVMLDLDHFEDVNDRNGHAAGDAVLVALGKVLMAHVRAQDTSCRLGGEEFALVLTDADVNDAVELVSRIRAAWSAAAPRPVTFSAGVAAVDADGGMAALLDADRALYEAKALGRGRTERAAPHADRQER